VPNKVTIEFQISGFFPYHSEQSLTCTDKAEPHLLFCTKKRTEAPAMLQPKLLSFSDLRHSNCRYLRANALDASSHTRKWKNHVLEDLLFLYWNGGSRGIIIEQTNRVSDPLVQGALHYFQEHACDPMSIKETALRLGLSPVQFTRRFQTAAGTTPIRYVTSLRLKKAQTLLLETNYTLDNIAEKCGYLNGFYFSRVFSAQKHMSPSQYRKLYRI
jgi:AraC-like DNA-binding protein